MLLPSPVGPGLTQAVPAAPALDLCSEAKPGLMLEPFLLCPLQPQAPQSSAWTWGTPSSPLMFKPILQLSGGKGYLVALRTDISLPWKTQHR